MKKKKNELLSRQREICDTLGALAEKRELTDAEKAQFATLEAEYKANQREITLMNQTEQAQQLAGAVKKDGNAALREFTQKVASREVSGQKISLRAASQNVITSGVIAAGDTNNMESAGIPQMIEALLNPLEMPTVYNLVGLKTFNNVKGKIVWPHLDNAAEASVNGELEAVEEITLDFSKISPQVFTVGAVARIDNEAVNDAGFDLVGAVTSQINASVSRTLNRRTLALSAPTKHPGFVGPFANLPAGQKVTFAATTPTYKELKKLKGTVLKSGANMLGFCYIMDADMYSELEATPKDAGSGRFIIEGDKIDGTPVFVTNLTEYAGVVAAGVFSYEALCGHGAWFTVDPFKEAELGVTRYILRANYSLTNLEVKPFAVGKKG